VAVASAVVYVVMRNELRTSVDHELQQQYQQVFSSGYLRHVFDDRAFPAPPRTAKILADPVDFDRATGVAEPSDDQIPRLPVEIGERDQPGGPGGTAR